ncbi:MAG: hypothetical protein AAGB00_11995 [Planctomycetota bacterium]
MLPDIFFYCTVFGGGALLLQVGMMLLGLDDLFDGLFDGAEGDAGGDFDAGLDADGDASGFWLLEMISIRTLTAATAFFGITGWICLAAEQSTTVSLTAACVAGYAAMYSVYWSFKQLFKLETSGNFDPRNTVGKPAQVYLTIPAERGGVGKVHMKAQGRLVEMLAVTEAGDPLKTGEQVTVVELVSSDTLLVERSPESTATV